MPLASPGSVHPAASPASVFVAPGARRELAATVAALRRPGTYPGRVGRVDTIETHMSWVFLTEDHAYKLKKPQRTRWFDHTGREARRRACESELHLNRRISPQVYLAVLPLVAIGGARRVGVPGRILDWLLTMRRLPAGRMLDAEIARGTVDRSRVRRAAGLLSSFYLGSEPAGWTAPEYRARLAADIQAKHSSLARARYQLDPALLAVVADAQRRWLTEHADLLALRAPQVGDLHGDLRPEHVYLGEEPAFIDCLDFDRELRLLDPISELAFLALECRRLGDPRVGRWFLEGYAASTGDLPLEPLVRFYQSYHAVVRAAVAVWHLDDEALDHSRDWRGKALRYLELARDILQAEEGITTVQAPDGLGQQA